MENNKKKKVAVLTLYHNNTNFGATLQAYALQKKIMEHGFDTDIIDFIPDKFSRRHRLFRLFWHPWKIPGAIAHRIQLSQTKREIEDNVEIEWNRLGKIKMDEWRHFCHDHIKAISPVLERNLPKILKQYDILLVGSDQVWNPTYSSEAHFLPYKKKGRLKIAYAASISRSMLKEKEMEIFRRWLPDFDRVTVRENEGEQLLEPILNSRIDVVLDPTLLLTAADWNKVAEPITVENQVVYRKSSNGNTGGNLISSTSSEYILFMALGTDPSHRQFAARVAQRLNMRLVILSTTLAEMRANRILVGDEMVNVSPGQYLSLVRGASLVITDSFHCMAFSINYRKCFYVLKRDADSESYNMNSRLYTLLGELGLEGQLIGPDDADEARIRGDLYDGVGGKLDVLRKRSEDILEQMLAMSGKGESEGGGV